jgi:hypothetical protein
MRRGAAGATLASDRTIRSQCRSGFPSGLTVIPLPGRPSDVAALDLNHVNRRRRRELVGWARS